MWKNITFFILIILLGISVYVWGYMQPIRYPTGIIRVGNTQVVVEVANTDRTRSLGLSNRPFLPEGSGMLFIFDTPAVYEFWMKDMNFPIDIIWIGEDKRIVAIDKNVSPDTYSAVDTVLFAPPSEVLYVLEVPAGFSEKAAFALGDEVSGL